MAYPLAVIVFAVPTAAVAYVQLADDESKVAVSLPTNPLRAAVPVTLAEVVPV